MGQAVRSEEAMRMSHLVLPFLLTGCAEDEAPTVKTSFPKLERVEIEAGSFMMGSPITEADHQQDETQHTVTLSQGFQISTTEITQAKYEAVMGNNPGQHTDCPSCPVENVSWFDALEFCNALSKIEGRVPVYGIARPSVSWNKTLNGYRLPTEAEWEYAARAGQSQVYSGSDSVDEVAWHAQNSSVETHPVGTKKANAWGLYDMSGNVYEWTWDPVDDYPSEGVTDPQGPETGLFRVYRGGSFNFAAPASRVADRSSEMPTVAGNNLGFRVVLPE
jgi:sulfatase modifying factor 1